MKKRTDHTYNRPRAIPGIENILAALVRDNPGFSKLATIMELMKAWKDTVGEKLAEISSVMKYDNDILYIKVNNSVWRNEFFQMENELKKKIRAKTEKIKITRIMFF